jgi:hypothetical protein
MSRGLEGSHCSLIDSIIEVNKGGSVGGGDGVDGVDTEKSRSQYSSGPVPIGQYHSGIRC